MKVSMKMRLKDHITRKLVTISPDTSMDEAYDLMRNRWIRHLPVVSADGFIIGMLSDRDVQRAFISDLRKGTEFVRETLQFKVGAVVGDYMTSPVRFFDIDTPLLDVVDLMVSEKCSSYLVSHKDEVVGIVTTEDLLKLLSALLSTSEIEGKQSLKWFWTHPNFQRTAQMISDMGI